MNTVRIDRRFRGPENSGNGGYSCGVIARALPGPCEVTLRSPPPLDRDLQLHADRDSATMMDGDTIVASAMRVDGPDVEVPRRPAVEEARAASQRYVGFYHHLYPECFVCGPDREPHDGLRIFAGPDADSDCVAATWTPEDDYADAEGYVRSEFIWSALDCPGYFALLKPGLPALLGRMSVRIDSRIPIADTCIVLGWKIATDGRKHTAGSALLTASGSTLAVAKSIWIELKPKSH